MAVKIVLEAKFWFWWVRLFCPFRKIEKYTEGHVEWGGLFWAREKFLLTSPVPRRSHLWAWPSLRYILIWCFNENFLLNKFYNPSKPSDPLTKKTTWHRKIFFRKNILMMKIFHDSFVFWKFEIKTLPLSGNFTRNVFERILRPIFLRYNGRQRKKFRIENASNF